MADNKKLKLAVVGIGMGGAYGAMIHKSGKAELAAICARTPEKLARRLETYRKEIGADPRTYTGVDEMLAKEKLDGVVICTPSANHHEIAIKVAAAGLPMLIDKPIDINSANIDKIAAAVKKAGVHCGVIYPQRLMAVNRGIKHAIENEMLGKILICDLRLKWHRTQEYYDNGGWRGTWATDGGGSLMNQGNHPVDLLCWLCGKPKSVVGEFGAIGHKIESEDWASGVVTFENGVRASITTTTCVCPKNDVIYLEVHGEKGSVFVQNGVATFSSIDGLEKLDPPKFEHQIHDFIDAIINNRPPMVSIEEARRSVELTNALYASAREGRRIAL